MSPSDVPFTTVPLGKTSFQITTSIGRSLQTYDLRRGLNLVFITRPQTPTDITATTTWKDKVIAAFGGSNPEDEKGIWIFKRGKKIDELEVPEGFNGQVRQLLVFGAWIVAISPTEINVWESETLDHYNTMSASVSYAGIACTMPTYLNKLFAGCSDGGVEIWNIATGKCLYTIRPRSYFMGAVTALEPSPALSLLAIAYSTGSLVIQNVRTDMEILAFTTGSEKLPTTSISFRTDGLGAGDDGQDPGVMATASQGSGDITFWDLNKGGRRMGILYGAHSPPSPSTPDNGGVAGGISKIEFLAGQAIIVSSGLDNSLKSWIFDEMPFSPIPRILHQRSGHAAPVSTLQFLPSDFDGADAGGKWLLSASRDRSFWGWSLRRDGQSTELSQGALRKKAKKMGLVSKDLLSVRDQNRSAEDLKAPEITCMACCLNRDGGMGAIPGERGIWTNGKGDIGKKGRNTTELSATTGWESVVTGHQGDRFARTWFWGRKRAGRWAFETGDQGHVTAVAMSPCGSFALVGSSKGGIDMFNLQSGIHRQRFPPKLTAAQAKKLQVRKTERDALQSFEEAPKLLRGEGKHADAVTGIVVDNVNRTVISCSLDGNIKFWDFKTGSLLHQLDWSSSTRINGLKYHRSSDLLALSCSDSCIRIIDITTRKLVRELWGCEEDIADFTFSNDGRWLVAASSTDLSSTALILTNGSSTPATGQPKPRSTIRIWDLPTAHLIDAFRLRAQCSALAFSNTGEFLATSSDDSVGVDIWTNRILFTHVSTKKIANDDIADLVDVPTASGEGGVGLIEPAFVDAVLTNGDAEDDEDIDDSITNVDQLSKDLVTLSLVPKAQWQTLRNLDLIRERNKPIEPPKQPEKAPFFLPSIQDVASSKQISSSALTVTSDARPSAAAQSRISQVSISASRASRDAFTALLNTIPSTSTYTDIVAHLVSLPPSAADLAIRSLDPAAPYTELTTFVDALTARLKQKRDFELVMVWMGVWVKCHGSLLLSNGMEDEEDGDEALDELRESLARWKAEATRATERLEGLVGFVGGVLGWVRDVN